MIFPKETRAAIKASEGRPVEIDWPEGRVLPEPRHVYTVQSSRRAGETRIMVIRSLDDGLRAVVCLAGAVERPIYLGKGGGYTTRPSHAMSAHLPPSGGEPYEPEPEPLTRAQADEMARSTRFSRLEGNRAKLRGLYDELASLRSDPDFSKHASSVRFIESLTHKLEADVAKDDARHLADLQEAS